MGLLNDLFVNTKEVSCLTHLSFISQLMLVHMIFMACDWVTDFPWKIQALVYTLQSGLCVTEPVICVQKKLVDSNYTVMVQA